VVEAVAQILHPVLTTPEVEAVALRSIADVLKVVLALF
jgi:hypothetical protein